MNPEDSQQKTAPQTPAQAALSTWVSEIKASLMRGRWAESRCWFEAGMFLRGIQWLEPYGDGKKLKQIQVTDKTRMPMPVTNLFKFTIAQNANSLSAALPRMTANADNYDSKNKRAAEAAQNAIDAANEESGTLTKSIGHWR